MVRSEKALKGGAALEVGYKKDCKRRSNCRKTKAV